MGEQNTEKAATAAIRPYVPEDLESLFSNYFVVQYIGDDFFLSFFEIAPPLVGGETIEEQEAALREMGGLQAVCVARIVVTKARLKEIHEAIGGVLKQTSDSQKAEGEQ